MLRSVRDACRRAYTCMCVLQPRGPTQSHPHLAPEVSGLLRSLHTSSRAMAVMSKDAMLKKRQLIHKADSEKLETKDILDTEFQMSAEEVTQLEEQVAADGLLLNGILEGGMIIPTEETHDTVVNGVPYNHLPIAHVHSSMNNTIILITDHTGRKRIAMSSCGMVGFKHAKKSTNLAAQTAGLAVGKSALKEEVTAVRVAVKGIGAGRYASITGLKMAGLDIISITDTTPIYVRAPKPRKAKRR